MQSQNFYFFQIYMLADLDSTFSSIFKYINYFTQFNLDTVRPKR